MLRWIALARSWHVLVRIGIATIAVAAVTALQLPVEIEIPGEPFLLYFVVVVVSASILGRTPGLFAVVESSIASVLYFDPVSSLKLPRAIDLLAIEIYFVVAALSAEAFCRLADSALAERSAAISIRLLLREMRHRVANDFAAVVAMLDGSAPKIADAQSREILQHVLSQVHVFAFVHKELSVSDEGGSFVSDRVFVERLGKVLREAIPETTKVIFEHAGNEFSLSHSQAVTLGLIINELVTNSVKYAFPDRSDGEIDVSIREHLGDCCVGVSDNGCGFTGKVRGTGKGIGLVEALAQELGGVLDLRSSKDGTTASIKFPIRCATGSDRSGDGERSTPTLITRNDPPSARWGPS